MKMSTTVQGSRNGNGRVMSTQPDDADVRYAEALRLVQKIDRDLQRGTRHYYDAAGKLLVSLDEVIDAILTDNLALEKPTKFFRESEPVQWPVVGELVA